MQDRKKYFLYTNSKDKSSHLIQTENKTDATFQVQTWNQENSKYESKQETTKTNWSRAHSSMQQCISHEVQATLKSLNLLFLMVISIND